MAVSTSQPARSAIAIDRNTRTSIGVLLAALAILIVMVGAITVLPFNTITQTVAEQNSAQQHVLAETLARQTQTFFYQISSEIATNAVRLETPIDTAGMQRLMADFGKRYGSQVNSIVLIADDQKSGQPLAAWPDSLNNQIAAGQALAWTSDRAWLDSIFKRTDIQLTQRSNQNGDNIYVLAVPLVLGDKRNSVLAVELNLSGYLSNRLFDTSNPNSASILSLIGPSSQIWIFDRFGNSIYQFRPDPIFQGGVGQFLNATQTTLLASYPTPDRESLVTPIFIANTATSGRAADGERLTLIVSRSLAEAQKAVRDTQGSLILFGVGIVGLVIALSAGVGRVLYVQDNRRRKEEQRRLLVSTLLKVSQAINSSLNLKTVLQTILSELALLLPHDSASVMLLDSADPDEPTMDIVARSGKASLSPAKDTLPLADLAVSQEVLNTNKPIIVNDIQQEARWKPGGEDASIVSWLGVPLSIRGKPTGILNINSHQRDRFSGEDAELAQAFADQACVAIQNARSYEFQMLQYEAELENARAIQTSLLPSEVPPFPKLDISAHSRPARQVSGDYYQYLPLPDGRLGIAVGDVSGKGMPAALLMAVITTALREEILRSATVSALFERLNVSLLDRMKANHMNSALTMAYFEPDTHNVEIANGGMVLPYLYSHQKWDTISVGGYPIGAAASTRYASKSVSFEPGDMLLFVSDGVIEAQNEKHEFFGFDRLEALLNEQPNNLGSAMLVTRVLQAVDEHRAGYEAQDDITVVAVRAGIG